jgi:enediyne biosynthesis protein E4
MVLGFGLLLAAAATLIDVSASSGITARLENGATAEKHLPETMVGGVALLDFDRDGKLDVFLTSGAPQPSLRKTSARYWNRLYRNEGQNRFVDVTERAGLQGAGFDIGAAAGDFDNDGYPDLFVAGVKSSTLYRNQGDGTFADITASAGLPKTDGWAVGGGWFDMDNDGDLDLFVVRYVQWNPATELLCGEAARTYCHPKHYEGLPNALYRNNGNGTFSDVSIASGIAAHPSKGMGLAFGDADGDGRLDVFVTNDTQPNSLFLNEGGGKFREIGGPAGVAFNDDGRALSAMGVDFRDWDNDGQDDLFVTALTNETFPLFQGRGKGQFRDRTYASQVGRATLAYSGWSAGIYDFDNDGWKDLFAACADVQDNTEKYSERASRQRNLLLRNRGNGTFEALPMGTPALHRGAAFGDLDGDGQVDAVVTRIGEPPLVLRNTLGAGRHWLGVRLRGSKSNRDGIGALVQLTGASGRKQWNRMTTAVGYASASEAVVHFGLGTEEAVKELEIRWPSGVVQRIAEPKVDGYLLVVEP